MKPEYKFSIRVEDETNDEVIYTDWAYSMESLEEKFYKIERSITAHEEKLEAEKEALKEENE